jgi:hypothetical protein
MELADPNLWDFDSLTAGKAGIPPPKGGFARNRSPSIAM